MNAYSGNEPYVFVSYCHADGEIVEPIIVGLKREMCRVWYDEGLSPGESWNEDLANHLNAAHCVIALLTENSIKSRYVTAEINFAVSHDKKIIPINLDGCALPIGLELMISHIQIANLRNPNINSLVADIVDLLPREVFASKKVPFYETEEYRFFLERYTLPHRLRPRRLFHRLQGQARSRARLVRVSGDPGL